MGTLAKPFNRILFLLCVLFTGAAAGSFVWLFFFAMGKGIALIWETLPALLADACAEAAPALAAGPFGFLPYPFIVCLLGGLAIGIYEKKTSIRTEELNEVMAAVKKTGRYEYGNLGKLSLSALLPLLFGGSIGPEAGLTGVIAGLCTWVGDRMRRFGADFRALTLLGTQAALTALFTAPIYGFVAPLTGSAEGTGEYDSVKLPKAQKAVVYGCAIAGALVAFMALGQLLGGGMGMPRFEAAEVGATEIAWLVPLALAGTAAGWLFHASNAGTAALSAKLGEAPIAKALIAGLILAVCGSFLPYTLFAGEEQANLLMQRYAALPAGVLIVTAFVKAAVTPACINLGWRGGHFFPIIFAGVSLGYGFALISGANDVFCVACCTASVLGAVMRQPIMVVLLLFMCFPPKGVAAMLCAAVIGSAIPLPKALQPKQEASRSKSA